MACWCFYCNRGGCFLARLGSRLLYLLVFLPDTGQVLFLLNSPRAAQGQQQAGSGSGRPGGRLWIHGVGCFPPTGALHPIAAPTFQPDAGPQGGFVMLALHMPEQSPNVGDPTSRQPRDRAGRQPRGPIHPSSSKGWDLGDTQILGLWAPWADVNQAAESMPREGPAKVLQQYRVIRLLRSTFVRAIGWAFYFQGFLHYSVFYLSPAETGEILLSPAGSSIQFLICKSSGCQSREPEGMLRLGWQGWISRLHLLWKS